MTNSVDVAIIGAGLAGLAAARQLSIHGVEVAVLEASDGPGGRVRSDYVDGFTLDRGFQLYNPAYPEAARVLDHAQLDLHKLSGSIGIVGEGTLHSLTDPRRNLLKALSGLSPSTGHLTGKAKLARYAWQQYRRSVAEIESQPDVDALTALRAAGVDQRTIDQVLLPFFSGVFLEPDLSTSRRFLDLVLRTFVKGTPSLPRAGMQAIADQLHAALPEQSVKFHSMVRSLSGTTVCTDDGATHARAVIVAADAPSAAHLLPGVPIPAGHHVTTWYHATDRVLHDGRPTLVIDPTRSGPLVNSVPLSNAVASYAPPNFTLISSSALTSHGTEHQVRHQLARMHRAPTNSWSLIGSYSIDYALPAMSVPLQVRKPTRLSDSIYIAGDYRATASIQGAMVSGRRAADAILQDWAIPVDKVTR